VTLVVVTVVFEVDSDVVTAFVAAVLSVSVFLPPQAVSRQAAANMGKKYLNFIFIPFVLLNWLTNVGISRYTLFLHLLCQICSKNHL